MTSRPARFGPVSILVLAALLALLSLPAAPAADEPRGGHAGGSGPGPGGKAQAPSAPVVEETILAPLEAPAARAAGKGQPAAGADGDGLALLRELAETRYYSLGLPMQAQPTPDGRAVLFLRSGPRDPVLRLYELNVATGTVKQLLDPGVVLEGKEETLSVEEKAWRERRRISLRGFTSFELSLDGERILLSQSGKLYVVRRSDEELKALPGDGWLAPAFSPDGKFVAAVHDDDLHVIELATGRVKRLTTGASETLTHGVAEFVAQEEMDRQEGFWWSPDSKRLVYQESDLSQVGIFWIADPGDPSAPPVPFRYPRAGTPNAMVRLGIVSRGGGATTWIRWDAGKYPYLARVNWGEERAPLTILVQDRLQHEEALLAVDPATGGTRALLTETDEAWLNLDADTKIPRWLPDGSGFLWSTERRGDWQLELRGRGGEVIRELTPVGFHYAGVADLDEKERVAWVLGGPDAREAHLYRVPLDGGAPGQVTAGSGVHDAVFSLDHGTWVETFSLRDGRRGSVVRRGAGAPLAVLPSVAVAPPAVPEVELARVSGGGLTFDAAVVSPRDFVPGRSYPVILDVYAGPGFKTVRASNLSYIAQQWLADRGYIVVCLDGRGTPGKGRAWERAVADNLIDIALEDQVAGLKLLAAQRPELDLGRVGVSGWSFGGYFAAMATIRRPELFRCGVAGAPLADWRNYDTHYTERYMGLPSTNVEGYRETSVLTWADRLERPLLLIHGLTDDNVYFFNTFRLAEAFYRAGKPYELVLLPGTHMVYNPDDLSSLERRTLTFFDAHLKGPLARAED